MRIDFHDKEWRRLNNEMEFTWRPFSSFDSSQDIFGHVIEGY